MSSKETTRPLPPVVKQRAAGKRPRRRSFRPNKSSRSAKPQPQSASTTTATFDKEPPETIVNSPIEENTDVVDTDPEESSLPPASDEKKSTTSSSRTTTASTPKATTKRNVVAVGASRTPPTENNQQQSINNSKTPQVPVLGETALLTQLEGEDADKPRLTSFCSRYSVRRQKDKNTTTAPPEPPATTTNTTTPEPTTAATTTGPVVQIVNGEIVLQESSMIVNGSVAKPDDEFSVVEEEAQLAVVGASYLSFTSRTGKPQHWNVADTALFYNALRHTGTDFGTMEVLFFRNKRTRKQLKRKFQRESIHNPALVQKALAPAARKDMDMNMLEVSAEEESKDKSNDPTEGKL